MYRNLLQELAHLIFILVPNLEKKHIIIISIGIHKYA